MVFSLSSLLSTYEVSTAPYKWLCREQHLCTVKQNHVEPQETSLLSEAFQFCFFVLSDPDRLLRFWALFYLGFKIRGGLNVFTWRAEVGAKELGQRLLLF